MRMATTSWADFIFQLTPTHDAYVVDQPLTTAGSIYNLRLNTLFAFAQKPINAGATWRLTIGGAGDQDQDDPFLGSKNKNAGHDMDF